MDGTESSNGIYIGAGGKYAAESSREEMFGLAFLELKGDKCESGPKLSQEINIQRAKAE